MPNRIIRDSILSSQAVCSLGWPEEVFYRRLMSIVDDYGRCEALPELLRARCYPLQTDLVRVADISRWMTACQMAGLIVHYELGGKQYLQIQKFGQQMRSQSKCPPPPDIICNQMISDAHLVVSVSDDYIPPTPLRGKSGKNGRIPHADDVWGNDIAYSLRSNNATEEEVRWLLADEQRQKYHDKPLSYLLKVLQTRRKREQEKLAEPIGEHVTNLPTAQAQDDFADFKKRVRPKSNERPE